MKKSKIDFISNLLAHKDINVVEKERLFSLTKNEILKMGDEEDEKFQEIKNRIEKIEKEVLTTSYSLKKNDSKEKGRQGTRGQHRPEDTKMFLSLFNNSDGLKYLSHQFNSDKPDYNNFIETCRAEFKDNSDRYPNTRMALLGRIEAFAFSENPTWYVRKGKEKEYINRGWGQSSFIEWYENPQNIHPWLDPEMKEKMIKPFKETIEIRAGNLIQIINQSLEYSFAESLNNFVIHRNEENLKTAEFYTDVDLFQQALFHIFSTIKDRAEKNFKFEISIDFENEQLKDGKFKKVIITHIDSDATKVSTDPNFAKGDLRSIQYNLFSLCNYEIEAKFPNGFYKRVFLTDDNLVYKENVIGYLPIPIDKVAGFTHILKFY